MDDKLVMLEASEEELLVTVKFVDVIDAANEELFVFTLLCNASILMAALELFVVIVEFV